VGTTGVKFLRFFAVVAVKAEESEGRLSGVRGNKPGNRKKKNWRSSSPEESGGKGGGGEGIAN